MIRLQLTKNKIISFSICICRIETELKQRISKMPMDIFRAEGNAHLNEIQQLSRHLRSKVILLEGLPGNKKTVYSISYTHAYIIIRYKGICTHDPYSMAILEEISSPLFQRLL